MSSPSSGVTHHADQLSFHGKAKRRFHLHSSSFTNAFRRKPVAEPCLESAPRMTAPPVGLHTERRARASGSLHPRLRELKKPTELDHSRHSRTPSPVKKLREAYKEVHADDGTDDFRQRHHRRRREAYDQERQARRDAARDEREESARRGRRGRNMTPSRDDTLLGRGANPRTGLISPYVLSNQSSADSGYMSDHLQAPPLKKSTRWRTNENGWSLMESQTPSLERPLEPDEAFLIEIPITEKPHTQSMTLEQIKRYQDHLRKAGTNQEDFVDPFIAQTPRVPTPPGLSSPPPGYLPKITRKAVGSGHPRRSSSSDTVIINEPTRAPSEHLLRQSGLKVETVRVPPQPIPASNTSPLDLDKRIERGTNNMSFLGLPADVLPEVGVHHYQSNSAPLSKHSLQDRLPQLQPLPQPTDFYYKGRICHRPERLRPHHGRGLRAAYPNGGDVPITTITTTSVPTIQRSRQWISDTSTSFSNPRSRPRPRRLPEHARLPYLLPSRALNQVVQPSFENRHHGKAQLPRADTTTCEESRHPSSTYTGWVTTNREPVDPLPPHPSSHPPPEVLPHRIRLRTSDIDRTDHDAAAPRHPTSAGPTPTSAHPSSRHHSSATATTNGASPSDPPSPSASSSSSAVLPLRVPLARHNSLAQRVAEVHNLWARAAHRWPWSAARSAHWLRVQAPVWLDAALRVLVRLLLVVAGTLCPESEALCVLRLGLGGWRMGSKIRRVRWAEDKGEESEDGDEVTSADARRREWEGRYWGAWVDVLYAVGCAVVLVGVAVLVGRLGWRIWGVVRKLLGFGRVLGKIAWWIVGA